MIPRAGWGILSTGKIAAGFAEDLRHVPGAELAAVGSRTAEAAEAFRTCLKFDPYNADAHHNVGVILESEGRPCEDAETGWCPSQAGATGLTPQMAPPAYPLESCTPKG